MIEDSISKNHDFKNNTELYNSLPRGVQHATFKRVLDYLEQSNKIAYDKTGAIFWIFAGKNSGINNLERTSTLLK
jgi:hypothetical protein